MILSAGISYAGIAKLKREHIWEIKDMMDEYQNRDLSFENITRETIFFMDTFWGKAAVLFLLVTIPYACGRLAFQFDYLYTGLFGLLAATAYFSWIAIAVRIFGAFLPLVRM
jgi:hypothetical protein